MDGEVMCVYVEFDVSKIFWVKENGVDIVLECIGFYIFEEKVKVYLDVGVKWVVIFVLVGVMKIIVYNVNDDILDENDWIILVGLCIINCLVFMVYFLNNEFGIEVGIMIIVYVYILI